MYPVQSWSTWSQVPWTPSDPAHSDRSSDQTTLSLDRVELETTGLRDTTQRELNWSTPFLMLYVKRLKAATVFRDSNLHTPLVVVPDLVWEHSSSPKSVKSTQTES